MKEEGQIIELITGNIPEEQKKDLLNQVNIDEELKKEFNTVKNAWALSSSQQGMSELEIERSYLKLKGKIDKQMKPNVRRLMSIVKYAAIVVVVFGAGNMFNRHFTKETKVVDNGITEIIVPTGQVAEVNLPDGSHVWLNAKTRMSFPNHFTDAKRSITLTGEAFFKVKKNEQKPFVVSTSYGDITVLGTSFDVCAFDDSQFQTTLVEGSVKYLNQEQDKSVTLTPGQQVILDEDQKIQVRNVDVENYTSWRNGLIVFDKEPLNIVIQKMERHFGVEIELQDKSLGRIHFTGTIANESLFEMLECINKTKPIEYTYDKKTKHLKIKQK